jgi:hypothetical protein
MFSLAQAHKAFNPEGGIANPQVAARFDMTIKAFMDLAEAAKHYPYVKKAWFEFLGEKPELETARAEFVSSRLADEQSAVTGRDA